MPPFEMARLWKCSLGQQGGEDQFASVREGLRSAYMGFRDRAALLAAEIARDLPDYTVHDISHIDSLWHLADLISGDNAALTPLEAFVLGGAFLIHDLGNGLAAYPDGIASLRSSPIWEDAVALALRNEFSRAPTTDELRHPGEKIEREVMANVLRRLHAEHAERLALVSWRDSDNGEQYHLIENSFLRLHLGKLIGRIAHSHWWLARNLPAEFGSIIGPPAGFPREWTVDPLRVACLLRVSDAAHLDNARAPLWLKVIRNPRYGSRPHWIYQEKLNQPFREGDRLVFTSVPFAANETEAWWMCFDALQLLEQELAEVDAILADSHKNQFAVRGVHGAGQADRLSRWVQTDGWLPVDTRIRVNDVAGLVKKLGGDQLYGNTRLVPLRELVQNASDAVRARCFLQSWPPERGEVTVHIGKDDYGHFVEVQDNGVGMSRAVLTGYLLDFGRSFWSGPQVAEELPGLLATGFEPTGKYGIGFFSVFMWSDHVRVTSRRFDDAQSDTHVLEFTSGLDSRPLLRKATSPECLRDGGTVVRVWLGNDPEGAQGVLRLPERDEESHDSLREACVWLCPSLDVKLFIKRGNEDRIAVLSASDWKTLPEKDLFRRILGPIPELDEDEEEEDEIKFAKLVDVIPSMIRPVLDSGGNLVGRLAIVPVSKASSEAWWSGTEFFFTPDPRINAATNAQILNDVSLGRYVVGGKIISGVPEKRSLFIASANVPEVSLNDAGSINSVSVAILGTSGASFCTLNDGMFAGNADFRQLSTIQNGGSTKCVTGRLPSPGQVLCDIEWLDPSDTNSVAIAPNIPATFANPPNASLYDLSGVTRNFVAGSVVIGP